MARIRSIKPEFWTSEQVMALSRDARLMFIGLWNFCDDGGNHPASAVTLKAEVIPGDDVSSTMVMQWVDELIEQQLVAEYDANGKEFWHVTGWHHQRIDQPTLRHPASDTGDAGDTRVTTGDTGHFKRVSGKQRQLIVRKIRDRYGDTCHQCGDTQGDTLLRVADENPENPHDARNYRLVCRSCKRKIGRGDTSVTAGDSSVTRGDTDGDSTRDRRVGDGSGEEGSLSPTQEASVVDRTIGDVSPPASPDPAPLLPNSRAAAISLLMRSNGIEGCNASNPIVQDWAANASVTDDLLLTAANMAKQRNATRPGPNYLAPIVQQLLKPPASKPNKRGRWWASTESMIAMAKELGIPEARVGEQPDVFQARIQQAINEREAA